MPNSAQTASEVSSALQLLLDDIAYADSRTAGAAMHVETARDLVTRSAFP